MPDDSNKTGLVETDQPDEFGPSEETLDSVLYDFEERENLDSRSSTESPEMASDKNLSQTIRKPDEPLLVRLRIFLWVQHQPLIAGLLFACLIGMSAYFVQRSYVHSGLIDLDRSGSLSADFQVDINTAELGEIVVLPGVGEKLGRAIVDHRTKAGRFESFYKLRQVPGIGEKKLDQLIPYLAPIRDEGPGE